MELDFAQQTTAFLWSIIPGIALGLIYGIIKFLRALFKIGKAGTFVLDIIFMIVFFLSVFIFSLAYIYGYIRAYVIAGFAKRTALTVSAAMPKSANIPDSHGREGYGRTGCGTSSRKYDVPLAAAV